MTACIDLSALYQHCYRITWDSHQLVLKDGEWLQEPVRTTDPWLMQIPCQFGTIYPHGGDLLALELDRHPKVAKEVMAISGVRLHQDGDHEKTFVFPASLFDTVAAIVQPKCRRHQTDEQRQAAVERLTKYQFRPARQSGESDLESTISLPAGWEAG